MKGNMTCLKCQNERFTEKLTAVPQVFRGEEFTVKAQAMVCTECGWFTMSDAQADDLCVLTADEYRRRHGLLTSAEIVACRKAHGKSQAKFAAFLGVGIASVKRWEGGTVQEPVYDDLIRRKCPATVRRTTWMKVLGAGAYDVGPKTLHVTTVEVDPDRAQHVTRTTGACTQSGPVTFHALLSDGHPWSDEHYEANDPAIPPTA